MELKKSPMPVQDAYARICNFDEVALGYTYETAVNEAKRCLNCKHKPCVSGCPVEIDIPAFLAKVAAEDMEGAYEVLRRASARATAYAGSRVIRWESGVWSGSWRTGTGSTASRP